MSNYDGAAAAIILVLGIAAVIAWLWIAWVAIGMLMVFFGLPSEFLLHVFLWMMVLGVCAKLNS